MTNIFNEISALIDSELAVSGDVGAGDYNSLVVIVSMVINVLIWSGFMIGIIAVALSAIKYTMSEGDPDKTQEAWRAFIYGVIAAAISLGAVALKIIVLKAFGVETTDVSILESGGY